MQAQEEGSLSHIAKLIHRIRRNRDSLVRDVNMLVFFSRF